MLCRPRHCANSFFPARSNDDGSIQYSGSPPVLTSPVTVVPRPSTALPRYVSISCTRVQRACDETQKKTTSRSLLATKSQVVVVKTRGCRLLRQQPAAVTAAHAERRAIVHPHAVVPLRQGRDLLDSIHVHDRRSMNPHETLRVERIIEFRN